MRSIDQRVLPYLALIVAFMALALPVSADPGARAANTGRRFELLGLDLELGPPVHTSAGASLERAYLVQIRPRARYNRRSELVAKRRFAHLVASSVGDGSSFGTQAIERVVALESALLRAQMPRVAIQSVEFALRPTRPEAPAPVVAMQHAWPTDCGGELSLQAFAREAREATTTDVRASVGPIPMALPATC